MSGVFVTIEGPDGVGKTIQTKLILEALRNKGFPTITVREPGGTEVGDLIRSVFLKLHDHMDPITEIMLLIASKNELIKKIILPNVAQGRIVISDRYTRSLYAYQHFGKQIDYNIINSLLIASGMQYEPDLTVYLTADSDILEKRLASRTNSQSVETNSFDECITIEHKNRAKRIIDGYYKIIEAHHKAVFDQQHFSLGMITENPYLHIHDNGTLTIESITNQIVEKVIEVYFKKVSPLK